MTSLGALLGQGLRPRGSARNAMSSIAENLAYPLMLFVATPVLVATLGLRAYGLLALVMALTATLAAPQTGLADAVVRHVAACRARDDRDGAARILAAAVAIALVTGVVTAAALAATSGILVGVVFRIDPADRDLVTRALIVGSLVLVPRQLEAVYVALLRAHERYDLSAGVATISRALGVGAAVSLALAGADIAAIAASATVAAAVGTTVASLVARSVTAIRMRAPLTRSALASVVTYWSYGWAQAFASVAFGNADRLVVAAALGPEPLAAYVICVQLGHLIHSFVAPAFAYVFPAVSYAGSLAGAALRRTVRRALVANVALSAALGVGLLTLGEPILAWWIDPAFASRHVSLLRLIVVASVLLSLIAVAYYVLIGLGELRFLGLVSVVAAFVGIASAIALTPVLGPHGAALSRTAYAIAFGSPLALRALGVAGRAPARAEAPG